MQNKYPALHNAMWPGLVGKGGDGTDPFISLDQMLDLTTAAEVDGQKFQGVDLFLCAPHIDIASKRDEVLRLADHVGSKGLSIGSLVAPVWKETGGGSTMGSRDDTRNFLKAVERACWIGRILDEHGVRTSGVIRIDSADTPEKWLNAPVENAAKIATTFGAAARIAGENGQRLAAEGEICWAGMDTTDHMLQLLESVDMPDVLGFQADLAHTCLYVFRELGFKLSDLPIPKLSYLQGEFDDAYDKMVSKLRGWTLDFHVAQNDGAGRGSGSHAQTGKHCLPDDKRGVLDITAVSGKWLQGAKGRGIHHICWDACMVPNETMRRPETWNDILRTMIAVRDEHGWN